MENSYWPFTIEYDEVRDFYEVLDIKDASWFISMNMDECVFNAENFSRIYSMGLNQELGSNKPKILS